MSQINHACRIGPKAIVGIEVISLDRVAPIDLQNVTTSHLGFLRVERSQILYLDSVRRNLQFIKLQTPIKMTHLNWLEKAIKSIIIFY